MSLVPLLSVCALFTAVHLGYVLVVGTVTENLAQATTFSVSLFIVLWISADARRRGEWLCYEFDFLVFITFPLSLFWWTWRQHRWLGLLLAVGLWSLVFVPFVASAIVWTALY